MRSTAIYKLTTPQGIITFAQSTDYWITSIKGLSTTTDVSTTQYAGQIGTTVNSLSVQPKKITVTGTIGGDVELRRQQLLDVLTPGAKAHLQIIDGTKDWYIDGIVQACPDIGDGEVLQGYQFILYCAYPYFRQADVSYQLAGLIPLFRTPFYTGGTWRISDFTPDLFKLIPNLGNIKMAFKVIFYARAQVVCPAIYNADKSSYIKTTITLAAGDMLTISTIDADKDAGNGVLLVTAAGVQSNAYKYIAPGSDLSMTIAPGGNVMVAAATENTSNLNCTLIAPGGERHSL